MCAEPLPVEICNSNPVIVPAGVVHVLDNRCPDNSIGRIVRSARFTSRSQHCTYHRADRSLVTTYDNDGRSAVAGDIGTRGICDETQVLLGQEVFDQLCAKLALHKRVTGNLADPASVFTILCKGEE